MVLVRKSTLMFAGILTLALALAACGGSPQEEAMEDQVDLLEEAAGIFEGVKDEASAKAAGAKLKSLDGRIKELEKRVSALPTPTEEEARKLHEKYGKRIEAVQARIMKESMRIAMNPQLAAAMPDDLSVLGR